MFPKPSEKVAKLGRRFDDLLLKAMHSEPGRRQQSIAELNADLQKAERSRSWPWFAWAAGISVVGGIGLALSGKPDAAPDPASVERTPMPVGEVVAPPADERESFDKDPIDNMVQRLRAIDLFRRGSEADFQLEPVVSQFVETCGSARQLHQTILVFLISLAQVLGMSAEDVYNLYVQKNKVNFERQDSGYAEKDENDNKNLSV